jgi:hypothetical protein
MDIALDDRNAYNLAVLDAYHGAYVDHVIEPNHVRAVYDAAARILDIHPDHTDDDDHAVWQLRAAYIDAFAAYLHATGPYWAGNSDYTPVTDAANALVAATAGDTVT